MTKIQISNFFFRRFFCVYFDSVFNSVIKKYWYAKMEKLAHFDTLHLQCICKEKYGSMHEATLASCIVCMWYVV